MGEETLRQRLEVLREEFEKGQHHLDALDRQRQEVRDTLLRIGGAIQVLEELISQNGHQENAPIVPDPES